MVCCFFGHSNTPDTVKDKLREQVRSLIENDGVDQFLVGTHGHFDYMVLTVLREMKKEYPHIVYDVILAYMPDSSPDDYSVYKPEETVFPTGLESVPRKFAILWRNDWMLKESDIMVCYVTHHFGGAGRMEEKATKQKKRVINLAK